MRSALNAPAADTAATVPAPAAAPFTRKNPGQAVLVESAELTAPGSAKQVRRFAFELDATYAPGDALGVLPRNSPEAVNAWLEKTGLDGLTCVQVGDESIALGQALTEHFDINRAPGDLPPDTELADWLAVLRPLQPRLYSISSSPIAHEGRVEITVSIVDDGVCTNYLRRLGESGGGPLHVFIQPNKHFGPPDDLTAPVVMIGPGTGVAPFRGFLHHRAVTGATGENWLLFGEQHAATDFLYRDELEAFRDGGLLTRLDTAFSRDQEDKVYVQHLMAEAAADLWSWITRGGHIYVCGDASRMARDVDETLRRIVAEQGRLSPTAADAYVTALAAERRYVRDIY